MKIIPPLLCLLFLTSCAALSDVASETATAARRAGEAAESAKKAIDTSQEILEGARNVITAVGGTLANAAPGSSLLEMVDWTYILGLLGLGAYAKSTSKSEAAKVSLERDVNRARRGEEV